MILAAICNPFHSILLLPRNGCTVVYRLLRSLLHEMSMQRCLWPVLLEYDDGILT